MAENEKKYLSAEETAKLSRQITAALKRGLATSCTVIVYNSDESRIEVLNASTAGSNAKREILESLITVSKCIHTLKF